LLASPGITENKSWI